MGTKGTEHSPSQVAFTTGRYSTVILAIAFIRFWVTRGEHSPSQLAFTTGRYNTVILAIAFIRFWATK